MSLQSSQRSHSAPHPLSSSKKLAFSSASSKRLDPVTATETPASGTVSPRRTGSDGQDAFHLDGGFFPRSSSYFSISAMHPSASDRWMYGDNVDDVPQLDTSDTPEVLSPRATLMSTDVDLEIEEEDRMAKLAYSALAKVSSSSALAYGPSYQHEHLFHSYDTLHGELSEKRRSATIPHLVDLVSTQKKPGIYDPPRPATSVLFSPTDENIDVWALDGETKEVKEGESWVTYMFEGARRLWVRKPSTTA